MKSINETLELWVDEQEISVELYATFVEEKGYGADADGNRGIDVYFLDELQLETINDIDVKLFNPEFRVKVESAAAKALQDYDLY